MEAALRPGRFIRYGESFAFVQGLERIARSIDGLVAEAPARAADLFETFLAGCYQKSEEIDDSSGGFGELMQHLCCRWVRARDKGEFPTCARTCTYARRGGGRQSRRG